MRGRVSSAVPSQPERAPLLPDEFGDAAPGQLEQRIDLGARERLAFGVFPAAGQTTGAGLVSQMYVVNADGSQRLDKQGKLRSASFDGMLYRSESKSATGAAPPKL